MTPLEFQGDDQLIATGKPEMIVLAAVGRKPIALMSDLLRDGTDIPFFIHLGLPRER